MILLRHELKQGLKNLLIWSLSVGLICWACTLLYMSVKDSLANVADMYANMGKMSEAVGLDKVSLATLDGYFATEIALMFGLGAGMFASMIGATSLSKEEEGHTSEFLYTLPYGRLTVVFWKYLSLVVNLLIFNVICIGFEVLAVWQVDLDFSYDLLMNYHLLAFLMQVELMTLCFFISSFNSRKQTGAALGITLLFYAMDMMCRVAPDLEKLKYITPYYFASGADVFSQSKLEAAHLIIAAIVIVLSLVGAILIMQKRDLKD
ncbi:ABC transporter permease subunit [Streptococcus henryi]|uniref:ABC transporter permease subunit n=1 Tax=Streptococcus henryi TaxID=439219 RepID=UPI000366DABD|nr:ABC transporter permease subunit [Streptococcus henryi]